MIKYNKVSIEDNKLIVDFQIEDKPYYSNVFIRGVHVDTIGTYNTGTHYFSRYDIGNTLYLEIPISNNKELYIIKPIIGFNSLQPFPEDLPCGADEVNIAVAYNKQVLLEQGINYLKQIGDTCEVSREFIDFILKKWALDLSISTCSYNNTIKYWQMLIGTKQSTTKGCGCYGR